MKIIEKAIDVRFKENPFEKTLGEVLEVDTDSKMYQIAVHMLQDNNSLTNFLTNYWCDKKANDLFDALCNYKEEYLADRILTFELFSEECGQHGIADACNRLFLCGLTQRERDLLNKKSIVKRIKLEDIYKVLKDNAFYNPIRLVL